MSDLQKQIEGLEFKNIVAKLKAGKTLNSKEREIALTRAIEIDAGERFLTGAEIGKILGISRQAGEKKIANGCLVKNEAELKAWENDRNNAQGKGDAAPVTLNEARLRKLQLESERTKWQVAILKEEYVSREQVREDAIAASAVFSAELQAMASDLPAQIAGLSEIEVRDRLVPRIDLLNERVRERLTAIAEQRKKAAINEN